MVSRNHKFFFLLNLSRSKVACRNISCMLCWVTLCRIKAFILKAEHRQFLIKNVYFHNFASTQRCRLLDDCQKGILQFIAGTFCARSSAHEVIS